MGQQRFRIVVLLCGLMWSLFAWPATKLDAPAPAWHALTPAQQSILAPVSDNWASMSNLQRHRLLAIAAKYPQLKPEEQERFQKRLTAWTSLTQEQRELARQNYKKLKQLPPQKQQAVKQKLLEKHPPMESLNKPVVTQPAMSNQQVEE
ncbi:DUF3106 domain-containing protein [Sulfuriferula nivalis]|uniref:DUF3106 domain-containing protein n=1 Tax=Sulfuriferula nivalis TaxID=2675298 RepID=A0A809RES6_9PROT|nr:DUF3106 domain-containing protein [Sulfuriferula nivalis]BBP00299.1 hypothetical protein SFSGTM_10070 [Sulfuriferula nivalis]